MPFQTSIYPTPERVKRRKAVLKRRKAVLKSEGIYDSKIV